MFPNAVVAIQMKMHTLILAMSWAVIVCIHLQQLFIHPHPLLVQYSVKVEMDRVCQPPSQHLCIG